MSDPTPSGVLISKSTRIALAVVVLALISTIVYLILTRDSCDPDKAGSTHIRSPWGDPTRYVTEKRNERRRERERMREEREKERENKRT